MEYLSSVAFGRSAAVGYTPMAGRFPPKAEFLISRSLTRDIVLAGIQPFPFKLTVTPKRAHFMTISFTNGWDEGHLKYLELLASDVYRYFSELVGVELSDSISLFNDPESECPLALFERDESGNFQVRLKIEEQGLWCKFIYQFAHELCHLYSNHSFSHGHKHKWLCNPP